MDQTRLRTYGVAGKLVPPIAHSEAEMIRKRAAIDLRSTILYR